MFNEKTHRTIANFLIILLVISLLVTVSAFVWYYAPGGCFAERYLAVDRVEPNLDCLEFEENTCQGDLTVYNNCNKEIVLVGVVHGYDDAVIREIYLEGKFRNDSYLGEIYLEHTTLNISSHSENCVRSILSLVLENQSTYSKGDEVKWNITAIYNGQNYTIYGSLKPTSDGFDLCSMLTGFSLFSLFLLIVAPSYWIFYTKRIQTHHNSIQRNLTIHCKHCGRPIDPGYKLCPFCGKKI